MFLTVSVKFRYWHCDTPVDFPTETYRYTNMNDYSPLDATLDELLNDRIISRYVTTVGYSSVTSVQEALQYQNQIFQQSGAKMSVADLLNARNSITPPVEMSSRRGFRA